MSGPPRRPGFEGPPGVNEPPVDYEPKSPSVFLVLMNIINTFTQISIGAVALGAFFYANSLPTTIYSLRIHIYLCVTGYVALMSQAILSLSPYTGWAALFRYKEKRGIHWVTQILGSVLVITGSAIRIANIDNHLETTHGILGVVALLFVILSLIGGIINLYSTKMNISPTFIRVSHAFLGAVTIALGFLTLVFGLNKDMYRNSFGDINANLMISLTVIALVGTILSACSSMVRRICS